MQAGVVWSGIGRCALMAASAGALICLGGCSSSVSRFDFPSFGLTRAQDAPLADPSATASIPVPQESVYASGAESDGNGSYARSSLPPASGAYAQVTPAAYSPAGPGLTTQSIRPRRAGYVPPATLPRARPAMVRTAARPARTETITVAQGDNLYTLSRRHGVSVEAIQAANNLPDARLNVGQRLVIPRAGYSVAPKTYKVEKGDTPHLIAGKLGVSERALIERNQLDPTKLQIGQMLFVPNGATRGHRAAAPTVVATAKPARSAPAKSSAAPQVRAVKTTAIPAPGRGGKRSQTGPRTPMIAASPEVTGKGAARGQNRQVASVDRLPAPEPMSGNSFRWPVQGRIISAFGTKPSGGHNDGINVAVPAGTSVKAAENGVVAYAGNELKGYGNLVLVRHSNNWVSAYAHNGEIFVKRGDQVRRGQVIAKAGNTGQVSQPQLHFELRKGSRPMDPTKFMSQTQANAN